MIANAAFLAALTVFGVASWLASELVFLAPYKATIFKDYGLLLGVAALVLFLNLTALYYTAARWLFLRETGRKLAHVDRQLPTSDGALEELRHLLNVDS
jgi:hypothetical protein